jgi:hypothetical protein
MEIGESKEEVFELVVISSKRTTFRTHMSIPYTIVMTRLCSAISARDLVNFLSWLCRLQLFVKND